MRKIIKLIFKTLSLLIIALVLFVGIVLATKYYPQENEVLNINIENDLEILAEDHVYKMVTWNIGYGALGETQDFFMDGGKNSGAFTLEEVKTNMSAIEKEINDLNADFILLQEVDEQGKRSKNVNQREMFESMNYNSAFAINYKNFFVPVPITRPMGNVLSGIMFLSKILPEEIIRTSLQGKEMFLIQTFELDRALMSARYPFKNKELVIINTHLSAFDSGGKIRNLQLNQLKAILKDEKSKGNYVILGGDFNHELPSTSSKDFKWTVALPDWVQILPEDFKVEGFNWHVDSNVPTDRSNEQPYIKDENFVAIIDGFFISDNIEVLSVVTLDLGFRNSYHNPIVIEFKLKTSHD